MALMLTDTVFSNAMSTSEGIIRIPRNRPAATGVFISRTRSFWGLIRAGGKALVVKRASQTGYPDIFEWFSVHAPPSRGTTTTRGVHHSRFTFPTRNSKMKAELSTRPRI